MAPKVIGTLGSAGVEGRGEAVLGNPAREAASE